MVVLAAYACFALRIAIPAGFMPAPLAQGGPVIVCDGGFDGALLARAAASHSHHHDHMAMAHDHGSMPMAADHTRPMHGDGADHEGVHAAWKHCPVGAVFGIALARKENQGKILRYLLGLSIIWFIFDSHS